MTAFAGVPPEVASIDADHVTLTVDDTVYPLEAVYGAAYIFIDRCFVLLDKPADGKLRVTLASKQPDVGADALRALVGEFANELLSCAWRHQIIRDNRAVIEAVTTQALAGAMGPPSLDDLQNFDFSEDAFEDPLGIAASWEEKYKKKGAKAEGTDGPADDAAPSADAPGEPSGDGR